MVNDHLSDFVTRIRNGYSARKLSVEIPDTKIVKGVAKVLAEEGYLAGVKTEGGKLLAQLKYENRQPVVTGILRVSKPGARIYSGITDLPRVLGGLGMNILSTPKGILGQKKARKINAGGEVLVKVW
jgi:small subunit ribosomal protein S8